jgi:hypothetical protein
LLVITDDILCRLDLEHVSLECFVLVTRPNKLSYKLIRVDDLLFTRISVGWLLDQHNTVHLLLKDFDNALLLLEVVLSHQKELELAKLLQVECVEQWNKNWHLR